MSHRLIEDSLPLNEISSQSSREKSIRHGHISTLHPWWARRPLASSRATTYAALVDAPDGRDRDALNEFVAKLSHWESSGNSNIMEVARNNILDANGGGKPPRVLDPYGGGGWNPFGGVTPWMRCVLQRLQPCCMPDTKVHH